MNKIALIILTAAAVALFSGCAASSESSEVMVDTSAKTKKTVTNAEPGDFEKMADPFIAP